MKGGKLMVAAVADNVCENNLGWNILIFAVADGLFYFGMVTHTQILHRHT